MKHIKAKTGTFVTSDGDTRAVWKKIGVIRSNANGEYLLLDPGVSLAGVFAQQQNNSDKPLKNVVCSLFDDDDFEG